MTQDTPTHQNEPGAPRAQLGFGRTPTPDPVDAAIERHRAAREELRRASNDVDAAMTASKQAEAEAEAAFLTASTADDAAWADLLATRPGDVPGAVRLLRYVSGSPASEVVEDPQDLLRQLTAAVEAAEGGGTQGEGVPADPALAVVADYRAAWDALGAAITAAGDAGVPDLPEAEAADSAAYARLRAVRPTTPAGFRALAETWAWRLQAERVLVEDGEPGSTASHAAASLIAAAGVCVPPPAAEPDPVFAAIAESRRLDDARHAIRAEWKEPTSESPEMLRRINAAVASFWKHWNETVLELVPATVAGCAALAGYVIEYLDREEVDLDEDGHQVLRLIVACLAPGGSTFPDGGGDVLPISAGGRTWPSTFQGWQDEAARHPGLVPFPAHSPRILLALDEAIRREAGRLLELAEAEIARRRAAYDGFHDPSVWPQVDRDLRREMRMDALAVAAGSLPADDGAADPRLCALVTAWEAAERAGNAPGRSDEERAPLIDHASGLLRDVYAFPARTMADICAKLPAYRDEAANTGDAPDAPDSEVTLEACALRGLVADLERLAAAGATGAVGERPEAPGGPAVGDLDAAALVSAIEAEWRVWVSLDGRERDEAGDRAFDASLARRDALLDAAEALPASSREARHAKALARAWMDWVEEDCPGQARDAYDFDGRLAFDINASFKAGGQPGAASSVTPSDAETLVCWILTTWAALARAEDASNDQAAEALLEHRAALLREAERLPATRSHLIAKALAFAWIGHAHLWRAGQAREDYAIDGRLALDIEAAARRPSAVEG